MDPFDPAELVFEIDFREFHAVNDFTRRQILAINQKQAVLAREFGKQFRLVTSREGVDDSA